MKTTNKMIGLQPQLQPKKEFSNGERRNPKADGKKLKTTDAKKILNFICFSVRHTLLSVIIAG